METEVVKECSLSMEEVEGFRQIFSAVVNWSGELDLQQIKDLLQSVVEFSDDETSELSKLVREVHPHGREVARFLFIRLVKKLTDDNLLGVNEAANRSMRRASMRKQRSDTKKMDEKHEKHKKAAEKAEREKKEAEEQHKAETAKREAA